MFAIFWTWFGFGKRLWHFFRLVEIFAKTFRFLSLPKEKRLSRFLARQNIDSIFETDGNPNWKRPGDVRKFDRSSTLENNSKWSIFVREKKCLTFFRIVRKFFKVIWFCLEKKDFVIFQAGGNFFKDISFH